MVFEDNMDLDRLRLEKTKEILQAELQLYCACGNFKHWWIRYLVAVPVVLGKQFGNKICFFNKYFNVIVPIKTKSSETDHMCHVMLSSRCHVLCNIG